MSKFAVKVEKLGKQYRIGDPQPRYKTLRESIAEVFQAPVRRLASVIRGQSTFASREVIWALKDVSFEVRRGDVVGIIGRNGAGKTTLLKILSRITEPTEGRARIRGRVGSLLEVGTGFHPELTGRENIYLNGAILGMRRIEINERLNEIVGFAEVEKFIDTPVKHYSSGMLVRLAFSVAAHMEPEILLVDEVLAVGDIAFQKKCIGKMESVAGGGRTVLFVSHDMAAISSLCTKTLLLDEGRLRLLDDTDVVVQQYQATVDTTGSHSLADRKDRQGNQSMRFTRLSFGGSKGDVKTVSLASGQPATVTIECASQDGAPLRNVQIEARILDHRGIYLFTVSTVHQGAGFDWMPPASRILCRIPELPLAPGAYQVDLFGAVSGERADFVRSAGQFIVQQDDFFGSGKLPVARKHGPFLVSHSWEVVASPSPISESS